MDQIYDTRRDDWVNIMVSKSTLYNVTQAHILHTEHLLDGIPHIVGTCVTVLDVYEAYCIVGVSPEDIATEKQLSLAQVFAALTFVFDWYNQVKKMYDERRSNSRN